MSAEGKGESLNIYKYFMLHNFFLFFINFGLMFQKIELNYKCLADFDCDLRNVNDFVARANLFITF